MVIGAGKVLLIDTLSAVTTRLDPGVWTQGSGPGTLDLGVWTRGSGPGGLDPGVWTRALAKVLARGPRGKMMMLELKRQPTGPEEPPPHIISNYDHRF